MKSIFTVFLLVYLTATIYPQDPGALFDYFVVPVVSPERDFGTMMVFDDPLLERSVTTRTEFHDLFRGKMETFGSGNREYYRFGLLRTGTIGHFPVGNGESFKGVAIIQWDRSLPIHNLRKEESRRLLTHYYEYDRLALSYVHRFWSSLTITLAANFWGNENRALWNTEAAAAYRFFENEIGGGFEKGRNEESFYVRQTEESVYTPMTANRNNYHLYFKTRVLRPMEVTVQWRTFFDKPLSKYDHSFSTRPEMTGSQWHVESAYRSQVEWLFICDRQQNERHVAFRKDDQNFGSVDIPEWNLQAYHTRFRFPTSASFQLITGMGYRSGKGGANGSIQSWPFGLSWQDALGNSYLGKWSGRVDLRTALLGTQVELANSRLNLTSQYLYAIGKTNYDGQKYELISSGPADAFDRYWKAHAVTLEARLNLDLKKLALDLSMSQIVPIAYSQTHVNSDKDGYRRSGDLSGGRVFRAELKWKF